MKTIKELEKSIGVSKVSLYSMLKREEIKPHVFKNEKNITLIDELGEELIKAHYFKEKNETIKDIIKDELKNDEELQPNESDSKADSKAYSKDGVDVKNLDIIMILQEQLQEKDEQIKNLLSIVLNQQQLQKAHLITDTQRIINNDEQQTESSKKGFWSKFFDKQI